MVNGSAEDHSCFARSFIGTLDLGSRPGTKTVATVPAANRVFDSYGGGLALAWITAVPVARLGPALGGG